MARQTLIAPKQQFIEIKDFLKGYQSTLDDERIPTDGLKTASNFVVEQNGTLRPRPSMVLYGTQPTGTIFGQPKPFIKMNGSIPEKWEATMQNVSGTTQMYVRRDDGGSFSVCPGKTFNNTAPAHLEQTNSKILITNGADYLSYLDIPTLTVIPFVALTTPTGVTASASSTLTTTPNVTYRYRITATNQGETIASAAATVSVNTQRDSWNPAASPPQAITINFNRVTGAQRYSLYVGTTAGQEVFFDNIPDPGTGTVVTYIDDGSRATNVNRLAPVTDSTAGPRTTRSKNVAGQVFMVGDIDNPYRLWYGSTTGNNSLDFSAFNGGGYVDIDLGGENFPAAINGFRDGKGNPLATVLTQGIAGHGTLVNASPTSTTLGDTVITYLQLSEAESETGTDAPDSLVNYQQSLWYLSRDGVKTTQTKPQVQNILSTESVSDGIIPDIQNLNVKTLGQAVGLGYQGRLYFTLPVGSTKNNQIWVYDITRGGFWMLPWLISADWIWLADDNSGYTHFKALSNNKIYEFSYSQFTRDDTVPFSTNVVSGLIKFDENGNDWATVSSIKITYLRPQGTVNFSVSGLGENSSQLIPLGTDSFTASSSSQLVGWNEAGWNKLGWNKVGRVPVSFGAQTVTRTIYLDDDYNYLQYNIFSSGAGTDFQVSRITVAYINIGPQDNDTT